MAISLNGIIAREDNEEDFLSDDNWDTFVSLAHTAGCMIWGRKTQEIVQTWEKEYRDAIQNITKVVISSQSDFNLGKGYIKAQSPTDALKKLNTLGFSEVILTGGSRINSAFAKERLINEVIFNIEPTLVGKGIPVFATELFDIQLELLDMKEIHGKIVQLHYKVL